MTLALIPAHAVVLGHAGVGDSAKYQRVVVHEQAMLSGRVAMLSGRVAMLSGRVAMLPVFSTRSRLLQLVHRRYVICLAVRLFVLLQCFCFPIVCVLTVICIMCIRLLIKLYLFH